LHSFTKLQKILENYKCNKHFRQFIIISPWTIFQWGHRNFTAT